jgi:hypothetical protein
MAQIIDFAEYRKRRLGNPPMPVEYPDDVMDEIIAIINSEEDAEIILERVDRVTKGFD